MSVKLIEVNILTKIICVSNNKGGTGKTTLAIILAQMAIEAGVNLGICDLDDFQRDFIDGMQGQPCSILPNLNAVLTAQGKNLNDLIIVDTPPAKNPEKEKAIQHADVVLVPVSHTVRALVSATEIMKKHSEVGIVLNLPNPKASLERQIIATAGKYCDVYGIVPQYARIRNNLTTGEAWYTGLSDMQKDPYLKLMSKIMSKII